MFLFLKGYSSNSYIQTLPWDVLPLSFTININIKKKHFFQEIPIIKYYTT